MWSRMVAWWSKLKEDDEQFHALNRQVELELANGINPLPIGEASRRAEGLLADPAKFKCFMASQEDDPRLDQLAPVLRCFFERYEGVEDQTYGSWVGRREIGVSPVDAQMLRIGLSSSQDELAVRPGQEAIYELAESGTVLLHTFTSIYHYFLYIDRSSSVVPD